MYITCRTCKVKWDASESAHLFSLLIGVSRYAPSCRMAKYGSLSDWASFALRGDILCFSPRLPVGIRQYTHREEQRLKLPLTLFVLGILADNADSSLSLNDLALFADRFDRRSYFHLESSFPVSLLRRKNKTLLFGSERACPI